MAFYQLSYDATREDFIVVDDYETGDFDITLFWKGLEFKGQIPEDVKLFIDTNKQDRIWADVLPSPISWWIISDKLLHLWRDLIKHDVQVLDPPLFSLSDNEKVQGYNLINPLRVIPCIDLEKSEKTVQK